MPLPVDDRPRSAADPVPGLAAPGACARDGLPLVETIVGPRCPLCGAPRAR